MSMDMRPRILVVDDERTLRKTLCDMLGDHGYPTLTAGGGKKALEMVGENSIALALIDLKLGDMSGLDVLEEIKKVKPDVGCILVTAHASRESAIEALNKGAFSYLQKPVDAERLLLTVRQALEKRAAGKELRELKEFHEGIVQTMEEGIAVEDEEGNFTFLNRAACEMLGYSREELLGEHWTVVVSSDQQDIIRKARRNTAERVSGRYEVQIERKDGTRLHVLVSSVPRHMNGEFVGLLTVFTDITERKKTEEELAEREKKFREIFNNANDALYVHRLTEDGMPGRFVEVNDVACSMLGYTREEFETMSPLNIDDHAAASKVPGIMQDLLQRGDVTFEMRHVTKKGDLIPVEVSSHLFELDDEQLVLSIARDITERKESDRALRESEEKYRRLFQTSQDCVLIISKGGRVLEMNPAGVELFGYESKEEIKKISVEDLYVNPGEMEKHVKAIERKGFTKNLPVKLREKDGTVMHTLVSTARYKEAGEIVGYQVTVRDVTELMKYIERIKQQSSQLDSLRKVGLDLVSELDVDAVLDNLVHHAVALADGVAGSFSFINTERDVLELYVHTEYETQPDVTSLERGEGLVGNVWLKGETIMVNDYAAWEERAPQWVDQSGHRAVIGVPVMMGEKMLGVLEISRAPGHPFTEESARLLELFANQAAVAINNAQLYGDAQQRLERLRSVNEIDRAISGSLDLKTTMDVLVDRLIQNLDVDAGSILLYYPDLQSLEFVTGAGFRSHALQQTTLRMGEGQAGRAALERQIIHIPDLSLETIQHERVKLIRKEGFIAYLGVPLIAKGKIVGVLEVFHRSPLDPSPEWINFLETLAGQAAIAIDSIKIFEDLQLSKMELIQSYDSTLEGWAKALELKDQETEGHARRVIEMTMTMADRMGLEKGQLSHIRRGALLHDIGKMGIPDRILQKEGSLDEEEWELMKKHPQYAYNLLSEIDYLQPALDIPYCHHEKWDGSGYPQGLKGGEIPLPARIFAVADVWDALRSDRSYREAWSDEKALAYIKEQAGKHFEPRIVEIFLEIVQGKQDISA